LSYNKKATRFFIKTIRKFNKIVNGKDIDMFGDKEVEAILQGIYDLNTKLGIWGIIIPVIFTGVAIYLLYRCYQTPGRGNTKKLLIAMTIIYIYSGFTILAGVEQMGELAVVGAVALWFVALLLLLDALLGWSEIRKPRGLDLKIAAYFLMFTGIFLYPLVEMALGFRWPGMVLFGAECPTTIFLIGLLIGSIPRTNKILLPIASINALFTGASVALHGAPFDWLYAFAGVVGIIFLILYFKAIYGKEDTA